MKKFTRNILIIMLILIVLGIAGLKREYPDLTFPLINNYYGDDEKPSKKGSPEKVYYYNLSSIEKQAYNRILDDIYDMPEKILVPDMSETELDNVFKALLCDNPDLIFLGRKCKAVSELWNTFFSAEYIMTKDEYEVKKRELSAVCDQVLSTVPQGADEWQTELIIHNYIVDNCVYKLSDTDFNFSSSYGALVSREAACEGYAKAAKLLMDKAGIKCHVMSGSAESRTGSGPHMWNTVCIDGEWYHLDCTWDDPVNKSGKNLRFYNYFNVTDSDVNATHTDYTSFGECTARAANYYYHEGLVLDSYSVDGEGKIAGMAMNKLSSQNRRIDVRFSNKDAYKKAYASLISGARISSLMTRLRNSGAGALISDNAEYYSDPDIFTITIYV